MKPTEGREAAYVVSHVKDNSKITNVLDFAGLFACVTPWGPSPKEGSDELVYAPVLIQDTDALDRVFGDPRIDPEKYRDLYAVREIVKAGFSVYISKVPSGDPARFAMRLNNSSDMTQQEEILTTNENGVLDIQGICEVPSITNRNGLPVLGFATAFNVSDMAAKYSIDASNYVEMRNAGDLGNQLAVKVTRTAHIVDGVEVGDLYTAHLGKRAGTGYTELAELASSGDSVVNAFDQNPVVSAVFSGMTETELLTTFEDWCPLESGGGAYHGAWKISTLSDLRNVFSIEETSPIYEIVQFWLDTAHAGEFLYVPFNDGDPDSDLARIIPTLASMGASDGSIIAIDTDATDWYSNSAIIDAIRDNGYVMVLRGSDVVATSVPSSMFSTYPSSVKMVSTDTLFGMNVAVAMAVNSTTNALDQSERSDEVLGRYLPNMIPCSNTGIPTPYTVTHYEAAKAKGKITFKELVSGDTRTVIANCPVSCTCLVEGVDYTLSTEVKDGIMYTRISIPQKVDSEGNKIPYVGGIELEVTHTKASNPYAEAVSSITDRLYLKTDLVQLKPKSLKLYAMDVKLYSNYDEAHPENDIITEARFSLPENLTNGSFISSLNSVLGSYLTFTLMKPYKEEGFDVIQSLRSLIIEGDKCGQPVTLSEGHFSVSVKDYQTAFNEFIDPRYSGCFISELSAMITDKDGNIAHLNETEGESERRALHYLLKMIAADRKDLTCVFTTPWGMSLDDACNWVNSLGEYSDLWEYGSSGAVAYADQSFYCEMYWDWIQISCQKLNKGVPSKTVIVPMSPCYQVIMKGLASYRVRGVFYPVAGEQGGLLGDEVRVTRNPSQKYERDKLINYHINPIYDLGVRGIQIYGNETLNPVYSDLSAAHIGRTLVYIRSRVDKYTNTQVFSLNDLSLWQRWKQYVGSMILAPLASLGGLAAYNVKMGYDTTSAELVAQRKINGVIELQFVPDAEVYTVEFVVNSSANTVESNIT